MSGEMRLRRREPHRAKIFTLDWLGSLRVGGTSHGEAEVRSDVADAHGLGHREDVDAARVAQKEIHEDDADFDEKPASAPASGDSSTRQGTPATREASSAPGPGKSNLGLFSEVVDNDEPIEEIEYNAWGDKMHHIDDFMLATMAKLLEGTALELPKDKKKGKSKKGKDTRRR